MLSTRTLFIFLCLLCTIIISSCDGIAVEETTTSTTVEQKAAIVKKVVDGDTLHVQMGNSEETIRLLLIDTPETKHPNLPVQPFGPEASQYAKDLLTNENITVEFGTTKRDKYDRLLAYVYIDGQMYNELIIKEGLARVAYVYPPNDKYVDRLRSAEKEAKQEQRGIWSIENYVTEDGFNTKESPTSHTPKHNTDLKVEDKDCPDFTTQQQAQTFFEAAGGPNMDPHRLDRDGDGIVCETLP